MRTAGSRLRSGVLLATLAALASPALGQNGTDAPRFLYAATATSQPVQVDARALPALGQRIAVRFERERWVAALSRVSDLAAVRFVYDNDAVPAERRVTLVASDISLAAVLTELLGGTGLDAVFSPSGQIALVARPTSQRQGVLLGRVEEAVTRAPVGNARIEVIGSGASATSREDGSFRLAELEPGVIQLRVTALGYRPRIQTDVVVSSGKAAFVAIELAREAVALAGVSVRPDWFAEPRETPTSTQRLNVEEIRRAPGAQEDVVRAVSALPGVAPTPIHRNDLIVRGGAPFENLFLVDGLEVPNINHFPVQGSSGGTTSLVNVDFLRSVEFSAGGFGASKGDRVGSLTTLELRDGITDRHAKEINVAATGFGVMAEGPLASGSYMIGLRRSYYDLLLEAAGESWFARYWDANAKITQRLGPRDQISWTFVGATDDFGFDVETEDDRYNAVFMAVTDQQYFSAMNWSRLFESARLQLTLGRTVRSFDTFQNDTLVQPIFTNRSTEAENSARLTYTRLLPTGGNLQGGVSLRYDSPLRYRVQQAGRVRTDDAGTPRPLDLDTAFTTSRSAAWADATMQLTPRLSASIGSRLDYYAYLDDVRMAPRLAATLGIGGRTTLAASGGRYWQAPSAVWLAGDPSNRSNLEPFRVDQLVLGLQTLVRDDLKLQLEAYRKSYYAYPARVWRPQAVLATGVEDASADIPFGLEPLVSIGSGRAIGLELFAQKRLSSSPVHGTAAVSFSRARFTALDGTTRDGAYDLPVSANLTAGWRPNSLWDLGMRFRLGSGLPRTPYVTSGPREGQLDFSRYNAHGRMPSFHALDIRADKRWAWRGRQLTVYLDVQDVYNRNNPIAYVWDARARTDRYEYAIGILPSIGINLEF